MIVFLTSLANLFRRMKAKQGTIKIGNAQSLSDTRL